MTRLLLGAVALAFALVGSPLLAPRANAELGACYSDPVVVLSNGVTLDLSATINDSESDISQVAYSIHAPAGISVNSITYTSGPLGPKEVFRLVSSGTSTTYRVATLVSTGTTVPVDASVDAVTANSATLVSMSGNSNQQIVVDVTP
ncbi:MAG TPA: hypothetical protein VFB58_03270 [Chloroflexota bacterium]|nr:hypothetical protein [Chloroflexota bacterium]